MRKIQAIRLFVMCLAMLSSGNVLLASSPDQKPPWQKKWDETLSAAKKEGLVRVALTGGPGVRNALKRSFEARFGVEVEFTTGRGPEQYAKIGMERSAGIYTSDVFILGNTTAVNMLKPQGWLAKLEPVLLLPEVTNPKVWRGGEIPFLDRDRMVIGYIYATSRRTIINTDLVKKGQIASYYDLLKPEWKGKIVMDDGSTPGPGNAWVELMFRVFNGDDGKLKTYLQQLLKQEPMVNRDRRLQVEWVARGKYPIGVGFNLEAGAAMKASGAPVDIPFMKEGALVHSASGTVCLANKLPHPNAAIVFLNWLLTQEGQAAYVKGQGSPSARLDVSTAGLDPAFLPAPGEKLHIMDEELILTSERLQKIFREIFGSILK